MPTSTEQIAELIRSNTELKSYFEGVRGAIDRKVADAEKQVDGFIAQHKVLGRTTAIDEDDEGSWERLFSLSHRVPVQVTISTTGGNFSPGATTFHMLVNWSGNLAVQTISKIGAQYASKIRTTTNNTSSGPSYVEIFIPHRKKQVSYVIVEALGHSLPNIVFVNEGINLPALTKLTPEVLL